MAKIHEILAAEPNVKAKAETILKEGIDTFKNKQAHFQGLIRTYHPKEEDGETFPDETQEIVTTVPAKVDYVMKALINRLDIIVSKEHSNLTAYGDITIDGKILQAGVCATALLSMEKEVKNWRAFLLAAPTLKPGIKWNWDKINNYYVSNEFETVKTRKVQEVLVKYPHTKEHPAQTEMITKDVLVGSWKQTLIAGGWTPARKAKIIDKVDKLEIAIKEARQRANDTLAMDMKNGQTLTDYIFKED